jgi:hypothetical protein
MTIDRALSGNPFSIDRFRCFEAASRLKDFRPSAHVEAWSELPTMSQFMFKSLFVSICQQFNWDFLQNALAGWLLPDPEHHLLEIAMTRSSEIESLLSSYPKPERIRGKQRAKMIRTTAQELQLLLERGIIDTLIRKPRLEGEGGFYNVMRSVSAFAEDDLEKKVRVLAHDLHREKILVFEDPQNLRPAVEYHILRLYIRSGRVYPTDEAVREELRGSKISSRNRLVKLLRQTVEEAMNLTAFYANSDVATLNYVEWQIGRAVCVPEFPHCANPPLDELPANVGALSPAKCVFVDFCRSYTEPQYGWYQEPHFQKAIY